MKPAIDLSANPLTENTAKTTTKILKPKTSKLQNPVTPVVEAIRDNDQTKREYLNGLADQVATICKIDIDMASPKTREALKAITVSLHAKHVSEADLSDFGIWWYDNTWQGKKGQPPTPTLIGDSWGQFEAQKVINVPTASSLSDDQLARYRELVANS